MSSSGPTVHDTLIYYQGDTIMIDVTCKDAKGSIINLNGASIEWLMDGADGNVVLATLGNGIEIATTPEAGKVEVTVLSTVTEKFAPGFYQDQLRVISADNIQSTQLVGLIEMKSALSRNRKLAAIGTRAGAPDLGSPDLEIPA